MPKKIFIIYLALIIFCLTGCWGIRELDNLVIVLGAAVDKAEQGQFQITIQSAKTSPEGTKEMGATTSNSILASASGPSVFAAARNLTVVISRRNYWPHTQVVIIGEQAAKEGISSIVDFFTRDSQRRTSVFFIVTERKGQTILNNPSKTEILNSLSIKRKIEQTTSTGYGVNNRLYKFIMESNSIPSVSLLSKVDLKTRAAKDLGDSPKMETYLDGTGVFYNYKLIGYLNQKETRAARWLKDDIKSSVIVLSTEGNDKDILTYEITKSKTSLTPLVTDEGYIMKAEVILKGNIVEYTGNKNLNKISLDKLSKKYSEKIKAEIEQVFQKAKEDLKVDLFGFGNKFANKYPYILKMKPAEWNKIFVDFVELDLKVDVKINSAGVRLNI